MKHPVIPDQHAGACRRQIGAATLYLGDAREILPGLPDASVNMIWTQRKAIFLTAASTS